MHGMQGVVVNHTTVVVVIVEKAQAASPAKVKKMTMKMGKM